ncbi:MAG: polysaccharide pyruvyl transferase family protein, partial [Muribaculaceae bacterium]|nr:polysaccharide pyruvyl transferase family protein [Muribaculaceae bacterium]
MKIGIVTQSLLGNYGGILQNFALQQVLKKLGHEPMTIDYVLSNSAWRYFRHSTKFHIRRLLGKLKPGETAPARLRTRKPDIDAFVKKHIVTTQMVERYERNVVEQHGMGALVVGSDQVWR